MVSLGTLTGALLGLLGLTALCLCACRAASPLADLLKRYVRPTPIETALAAPPPPRVRTQFALDGDRDLGRRDRAELSISDAAVSEIAISVSGDARGDSREGSQREYVVSADGDVTPRSAGSAGSHHSCGDSRPAASAAPNLVRGASHAAAAWQAEAEAERAALDAMREVIGVSPPSKPVVTRNADGSWTFASPDPTPAYVVASGGRDLR